MSLCEHCLAFSGIYNANRRCCQVRMIALMPPFRRAQAYEAVRQKRGDDAEVKLRELVGKEYLRWKAYRAAFFGPRV
jgi:hypothetical protein